MLEDEGDERALEVHHAIFLGFSQLSSSERVVVSRILNRVVEIQTQDGELAADQALERLARVVAAPQ